MAGFRPTIVALALDAVTTAAAAQPPLAEIDASWTEVSRPNVHGSLLTIRSVWQRITTTTGPYATNSGIAHEFLRCSPAEKPYMLKDGDY